MKKQNILRASGALLIIAVLALLSACEVFTSYEPVARFLSVGMTDENVYTVTVLKSSKSKTHYSLSWDIEEGTVSVKTEYGDECTSGINILNTTTYTFTVTDVTSDTCLFIDIRNDDTDDVIDSITLTFND